MKYIFTIILLVLIFLGKGKKEVERAFLIPPAIEILDKTPEFFILDWKVGTTLSPKKIDFFIEADSMGRHEVIALVNKKQEPVLFTSDITTPVCADGECKLMNIRLYWTLLGEYAGFDRYPEQPLTKYDHDVFVDEDYKKLHELLIDDKNILGRRSIKQLVEKPKMRTVNGVDAISGATIAQVKESVVPGALYSCYTAWHLVHSDIRKQLKTYFFAAMNDNMLIDMLYSNNEDYQLFVLEKIDQSLYKRHFKQIAQVFKTSTPLVRSIIAKNLISNYKEEPDLQKPFWDAFDALDVGSRSLLLKNLGNAPGFAADILSGKLRAMSKNQLKSFLSHLSETHEASLEIQNNIEAFANSDSETYAYLVKEYIEENQ